MCRKFLVNLFSRRCWHSCREGVFNEYSYCCIQSLNNVFVLNIRKHTAGTVLLQLRMQEHLTSPKIAYCTYVGKIEPFIAFSITVIVFRGLNHHADSTT